MNKSASALTLLSVLSASALAQSTVTIYGIVDAGVVVDSGGPAPSATRISSGVASGSRIGFKGKEDLGGGLAAVFQFENGFNVDTGAAGQSGLLFGRQAFVGLSGKFGVVTLGRQYNPYYKTLRDIGDPFGAVSLAGRSGNLFVTNTRTDNMVEYLSPSLAGFRADLAYGAGEAAGDSSKNRTMGGSLGYAGGPLSVQLAYHRIENAAGTDFTRNALASANYNFKAVVAYASYAINKGPALADSRDMLVGVAIPVGAGKLLLSHVRHEDETAAANDASQWGIGYTYRLSKRSDLYAAYAVIDNRNAAAFRVGTATDRGTGERAVNLGLRHNF